MNNSVFVLLGCECACVQACVCTGMRVYRHACVQACVCTGMRANINRIEIENQRRAY